MYKRLLELPLSENSNIVLFGPRGTGKTSWLKAHLPNALYLDLLEFETYRSLLSNPGRLENLIPPKWEDWAIIDLVQRVPELLNQIHRLIENRKVRFILTVLSACSLRRKGVNWLARRALYNMSPLVSQEVGDDFNFD